MTVVPGRPPFPAVDFARFHDGPAQALAVAHVDRLADGLDRLDPLAVSVAGSSVTYRPSGGQVVIEPGVAGDAATAVQVDRAAWSDWLHELHSNMGLVYGSMVEFDRGGFDGFAAWEPALRAVWCGRPARVPPPGREFREGI